MQQHVVLSYKGEGFGSEEVSDAYGPFESEIEARQWATNNVSTIGTWLVVPLHFTYVKQGG